MLKLKPHHLVFLLLANILATSPLLAAESPLEQRVTRLEKLVEGQGLVELYLQLETLQQEVKQLRGESEVQAYSILGLKQRQRDLYLDIDRRLRQLESGAVAAPPAKVPTTPTASAPAATTPDSQAVITPPVANSVVEETAYRAAFQLLKEGRYAPASSRFRAFLVKYPNSAYADNAQYWLGEISYVTRAYKQAIVEFGKVLSNYPDSSKHADALLKQAYCYYELKDFTKAKKLLTDVVARYPHSTAARLAGKRRQKIDGEGH